MLINVLTAVTRPDNLPVVQESIVRAQTQEQNVALEWHRYEDLYREHVGGQHPKNVMLDRIEDGWVCILDDDTIMHPSYLRKVYRAYHHHPSVSAIVVSQRRTTGVVLMARAENMVIGSVDAGQVLFHRDLIGDVRIPEFYGGDGEWIETLLHGRDDVLYMPQVLSLHNALSGIDVSETPERMARP